MIGGILDTLALLASFARTRWGYRFRDRGALLDYQQRRIARLLLRHGQRTAFYGARRHLAFERLPIVDKGVVLAAFAEFNVAAIDLQAARETAFKAERNRDFNPVLPGDITVGSSSGTSGRPGVFLIGRHERHVWAGAMLARMLSPRLLRRMLNPLAPLIRVALFLRASSNLYTTIRSARVRFEFFDLFLPLESHAASLSHYSPDVLVAPASVLNRLAGCQREGLLEIHPAQVISVAETLEEDDAKSVSATWQTAPQQIYQCTEGFLGYSCAEGSLHLNEEFMHIEPEWLDTERRRFVAVVTDFSRTTQLFVRFRMDDVLHWDPNPCPCGRITRRLRSIEGRQDDVLWLPALDDNSMRPIFPDVMRRAMMLAIPEGRDYRMEQHGMALRVSICGDAGSLTQQWECVERELGDLWSSIGVHRPQLVLSPWAIPAAGDKRRRIRCLSDPGVMRAGPPA